jgi:hypothetical protein
MILRDPPIETLAYMSIGSAEYMGHHWAESWTPKFGEKPHVYKYPLDEDPQEKGMTLLDLFDLIGTDKETRRRRGAVDVDGYVLIDYLHTGPRSRFIMSRERRVDGTVANVMASPMTRWRIQDKDSPAPDQGYMYGKPVDAYIESVPQRHFRAWRNVGLEWRLDEL